MSKMLGDGIFREHAYSAQAAAQRILIRNTEGMDPRMNRRHECSSVNDF